METEDDHEASERDQGASDSDQTGSDADQTGSDADQTASDADQTSSDRDQLQSEADERSSHRDQEAADRELGSDPSGEAMQTHQLSQLARERGNLERQATALSRARVASQRDRQAAKREDAAQQRDRAAASRDMTAEVRDHLILESARRADLPREERLQDAVNAAAQLRSHAAADRERAARDRERAAEDRAESAQDRRELYEALDAAHLDELTGAYRRGMGEIVLRNELDRARRATSPLTLVAIDADDLKALNDAQGHAAGDAFLREIATTVRANLRPHDPLVRTGGDEFICTLTNSNLDSARLRFDEVSARLASTRPGASISVGMAEMEPGETLEALIERGDAALYAAKRKP